MLHLECFANRNTASGNRPPAGVSLGKNAYLWPILGADEPLFSADGDMLCHVQAESI